jgi:hypothetical protein
MIELQSDIMHGEEGRSEFWNVVVAEIDVSDFLETFDGHERQSLEKIVG